MILIVTVILAPFVYLGLMYLYVGTRRGREMKKRSIVDVAGDLICEEHPSKEWPHEGCGGAGMPMRNLLALYEQAERSLAAHEDALQATAKDAIKYQDEKARHPEGANMRNEVCPEGSCRLWQVEQAERALAVEKEAHCATHDAWQDLRTQLHAVQQREMLPDEFDQEMNILKSQLAEALEALHAAQEALRGDAGCRVRPKDAASGGGDK